MAPPAIASGAVHLWQADLRLVPPELTDLLSATERRRAQTILPPGPRQHWPRSRALLRLLLARYSGRPAGRLTLAHGANGKPLLAGSGALHFNLSHSGPLALYAFSAHGPVGVDVERAGRRPSAFLRRWTRHEAAVKCLGGRLGPGGPPPGPDRPRSCVGGPPLGPDRPRSCVGGPPLGPDRPGSCVGGPATTGGDLSAALWLADLELGELAFGAIACRREPTAIVRFSWTPPAP